MSGALLGGRNIFIGEFRCLLSFDWARREGVLGMRDDDGTGKRHPIHWADHTIAASVAPSVSGRCHASEWRRASRMPLPCSIGYQLPCRVVTVERSEAALAGFVWSHAGSGASLYHWTPEQCLEKRRLRTGRFSRLFQRRGVTRNATGVFQGIAWVSNRSDPNSAMSRRCGGAKRGRASPFCLASCWFRGIVLAIVYHWNPSYALKNAGCIPGDSAGCFSDAASI